jgi:hypothetical protein
MENKGEYFQINENALNRFAFHKKQFCGCENQGDIFSTIENKCIEVNMDDEPHKDRCGKDQILYSDPSTMKCIDVAECPLTAAKIFSPDMIKKGRYSPIEYMLNAGDSPLDGHVCICPSGDKEDCES